MFLELVLAIVEDLANGRFSVGRYLHQVQARFICLLQGGLPGDDSEIFSDSADQAYGFGIDLVIDARPVLGRWRG